MTVNTAALRNIMPCVVLLVAGCAAQHEVSTGATGTTSTTAVATAAPARLPDDATRLISQVTGCAHLSGEVGSGDPAQERATTRTMRKLDCDERVITRNLALVRQRHAGEAQVLAAVDAALQEVKDDYDVIY